MELYQGKVTQIFLKTAHDMSNNVEVNKVFGEFFRSVEEGFENIGNSIQDGCAQLAKDFREACTQSTFSKMFDRLFGVSSHFEPRRSDENQNESTQNTGSIVGGEPPLIEDELPRELPRLNSASLEIPKLITAYRKAEANLKRAEEVFKSISTEGPSTSAQEESDAGDSVAIGAAKRALTKAQSNFKAAKKKLESMVRQLEPTILERKEDQLKRAYFMVQDAEVRLSQQQVIVEEIQAETDDLSGLCEKDSWDLTLNPGLRPKWEGMTKEKFKTLEEQREKMTHLESEFVAAKQTLDSLQNDDLIFSILDESCDPHIYKSPRSFIDDLEFELKFELSKLNSLKEQRNRVEGELEKVRQGGIQKDFVAVQVKVDQLSALIKEKIDIIAQLEQSMRE